MYTQHEPKFACELKTKFCIKAEMNLATQEWAIEDSIDFQVF